MQSAMGLVQITMGTLMIVSEPAHHLQSLKKTAHSTPHYPFATLSYTKLHSAS